MMNFRNFKMRPYLLACAGITLTLTGCWERPPIDSVQGGFRGTGMVAFSNPRDAALKRADNIAPEAPPVGPTGGPTASSIYKNLQVLGGLDISDFTRTMVAITSWVAPKEGCNYCHKLGEDFSADTLYTKVVARRMFQMTQALNSEWKTHTGATGVTCYTCHHGQNIPKNIWFNTPPERQASRMVGGDAGQNRPVAAVGYTSMPYDPFSMYLTGSKDIRVASTFALPTPVKQTIKDTEATYSLMFHISDSLGVNCNFCHNSQAFSAWEGSTPQRVTAWHGIRMARDINNAYMTPLTSSFPASRRGPQGDVAKVSCATCHQGVNKPLLGAQMAKDFPGLLGPVPTAAPNVVAVAAKSGAKK